MAKFTRISLLSLVLGLIPVLGGAATLVPVTDPTAPGGADNVTRDLATGLEWLDLTTSLGLSYDDVQLQFGPGGGFEGWRHATTAEVTTLFLSSAGLTLGTQPGVIDPLVTGFAGLFGVTQAGGPANAQAARGRYDDSATGSIGNSAGSAFVYWQQSGLFGNESQVSILDDQPAINSEPTTGTGHFLVRNTIPEPTTSALGAFTCLWLLGARRRASRP